jgi:hypothetical protein
LVKVGHFKRKTRYTFQYLFYCRWTWHLTMQ